MADSHENQCYEPEISTFPECSELDGQPDYKTESALALQWLKDGNKIYFDHKKTCFDVDKSLPNACGNTVRPIAVIVSCSDNRVSPELVFAQSIGRLFVIRIAGNTIDAPAMGSLEYALDQLRAPLVVVMGHQNCGAVKSAVEALKMQDTSRKGSIGAIIEPILPAVVDAGLDGEDVDKCAEKISGVWSTS